MFYGLPIHIMRDLFMTARSFVKRLGALMRYRKALQDMNRYPDATQEELSREDTCIICREEMRPWDPTAGAVERSRPKKLPCGHILHFGCLKSWLERQQVCPTCRRSVVIDGGAHADAAAGRMNGQAAAPGQPAPNDGAANAARPAPGAARAPNMRVFQLGPIRLGFAQGNPANIDMQDMAQRLRQPLDGANVPVAPAPPAQSTPGGNVNLNNTLNTIADMQSQLSDIAQRIQTEMQALQNSHNELQNLYLVTAELNRLRHLQQQQQQQQSLTPAAQPGQAPQQQQPLAQPPMATLQIPFPQPAPGGIGFQIPPFRPDFPQFPPRINSPTITRHGGTSYSAAIPAGSPDLPEGVVIPDGWSLLPLQRLDEHGAPVNQGPQVINSQPDIAGQSPAPVHPTNGHVEASNAQINHASQNTEVAGSSQSAPLETEPARTTQAHGGSPVIATPTPVMPNWGGSAQLFSNSGASSATPPPNEPKAQSEDGSFKEDEGGQAESSNSESKGKAKAATVEDAEDE
jgi:E3 ubiquitin-protein ligase synoviolin